MGGIIGARLVVGVPGAKQSSSGHLPEVQATRCAAPTSAQGSIAFPSFRTAKTAVTGSRGETQKDHAR